MMQANAPSGAGRAKRHRLAALVAMALLLLPQAAAADLVGHVEERAAVAGRPDTALIEANPLLRQLRREYPQALPDVLERLRAPAASYGRSLKQAKPPPEGVSGVLAANPDLETLYRESPEAALDLIRLIREAAKKK